MSPFDSLRSLRAGSAGVARRSPERSKGPPVILVHGGAWAIPDDLVEAHVRGVRNAVAEGWRVLAAGGSALDAVEAAVATMEDDEAFDAGRGSFLNADGRVQLDACIMDGATLRAGGVGCVERVRNPIRAARRVLEESPHVYFVGEGAERFAQKHGIALIDNSELVIPREVERLKSAQQAHRQPARADAPEEFSTPAGAKEAPSGGPDAGRPSSHDTVGAVAFDSHRNLAAANSTGGTLNKTPGRVGDSSLIGCGCYADNESAAACTTGWGEPIMKLVLGKWAVDRVAAGTAPQEAAQMAIEYLKRRLNGHGGLILVDPKGRVGLAHNTPRMAWAWKREEGEAAGIRLMSRQVSE